MSKVARMMAARSAGDTWSNDPNRKMGFDMRSESERRSDRDRRMNDDSEMRMGGYGERYERGENNGARYERGNDMRMGGYDSPESVRRSPRTGRFIRGEMNDVYDRRRDADTGRFIPSPRSMDAGRTRSAYEPYPYMQDPQDRGGYDMNISQTRRSGSRAGGMGYAEHDEDEEEDMEFSEKIADEWTKAMQNEDGSKGPHWSKDQTRAVMVQHGIVCDPIEFFAIMNSLYSDYSAIAKRYGVDRPDFYAHMAKAWLEDKDAVDDKAAVYYRHIVREQ